MHTCVHTYIDIKIQVDNATVDLKAEAKHTDTLKPNEPNAPRASISKYVCMLYVCAGIYV